MITTRIDFQMNTENNESQRGSSKQSCFIQYFLFNSHPTAKNWTTTQHFCRNSYHGLEKSKQQWYRSLLSSWPSWPTLNFNIAPFSTIHSRENWTCWICCKSVDVSIPMLWPKKSSHEWPTAGWKHAQYLLKLIIHIHAFFLLRVKKGLGLYCPLDFFNNRSWI